MGIIAIFQYKTTIMSRILFLITLFFAQFIFAQNFRIYYQYDFKIDSTNLSNDNKEVMVLDVTDKKSTFISYQKLIQDSLLYTNSKNYNQNLKPIDLSKSKINYFVTKNSVNDEVILHDKIGFENYSIKENEKIYWEILNDTKTINNILVQKAKTTYLGRNWEAWFSQQYPIQEGPYKFYGLPGLIFELYDDNKQHIFTFAGLKRNQHNISSYFKQKEIIISSDKYKKLWLDYKKNPSKFFVSNSMGGGTSFSMSLDGKSYNESEIIKRIEEQEKQKILKNNNFLDLKLYK